MLRWSAEETGREVDVRAVVDPEVDPRLPGGRALVALATATITGDAVAPARNAVAGELGPAALVDTAAIVGNFEMMNRIADGVGIPVGRARRAQAADLVATLHLDRFPHA